MKRDSLTSKSRSSLSRGADQPFHGAVDAVVRGSRTISRLHAEQAVRVERARREGCQLGHSDRSPAGPTWSPQTIADRELVTELEVALRISESDSHRLIDTSRALVSTGRLRAFSFDDDQPDLAGFEVTCSDDDMISFVFDATFDALYAGEISWRHAEKIVQHSCALPPELLRDYEIRLLPVARRVTPQRLDREARGIIAEVQASTAAERHQFAALQRRIFIEPAPDGMAYLTAFLPAVEAHAIYARVDQLARTLRATQHRAPHHSVSTGTPGLGSVFATNLDSAANLDSATETIRDTDTRTLAQLRLDSFSDLLVNGETSMPGAPRGIRAGVTVTVPALTLLGHSDELPTLHGYGPIDPLTAAALTRDAPTFVRVLTDPMTGLALSFGHERYKPGSDLDRLVRLRHGECTFPAPCQSSDRRADTHTGGVDLDHTLAWSEGGTTDLGNLSPLCTKHHKVKHHTAWLVRQSPTGTMQWTSPSGHRYDVEPTPISRPFSPADLSRVAFSESEHPEPSSLELVPF